jgi:hypothetical protein
MVSTTNDWNEISLSEQPWMSNYFAAHFSFFSAKIERTERVSKKPR